MTRGTTILLRVACVVSTISGFVYMVTLGNGRTFVMDEWQFVAIRNSFSWDSLVSQHGGHFVLIPALWYISIFRAVGLDHPEIFRYAVLIAHACVAWMTALFVRRRHGEDLAILGGVFIFLAGAGAQNILWGFQISMVLSLLMYLVSLWFLLRTETEYSRQSVILSSLALVVAVMSTGVGVAGVAAVGAASLVSRDRRRLWWVSLPASGLFMSWSLVYGETRAVVHPHHLLGWIDASAAGTFGAMFDLGRTWGVIASLIVIGLIILRLVRKGLTVAAVSHLVFSLVFWTMTGMSRWYSSHVASRYLYIMFPVVVLLVSELVVTRNRPRAPTIAIVALFVVVSLVIQFPTFREDEDANRGARQGGTWMKGRLAAVELLSAELRPDTPLVEWLGIPGKGPMNVGEYLAAVDSIGDSPAQNWRQLTRAPAEVRRGADEFLNSSDVVRVEVSSAVGCAPRTTGTEPVVLRGGQSVTVASDVDTGFSIRRFYTEGPSSGYRRDIGRGPTRITAPRDLSDSPWQLFFDEPVAVLTCETP